MKGSVKSFLKKSGKFKLIFKLTAPIVAIVIVVFMGVLPLVLYHNTSVLEKSIQSQLIHLSSLWNDYIRDDVEDLQKELKLLVNIPLNNMGPGMKPLSVLKADIEQYRKNLNLNFLAISGNNGKLIILHRDDKFPVEAFLQTDSVKKALKRNYEGTVEVVNDKLVSVAIASSSLLELHGVVVAARILSLPSRMSVEGILNNHDIVVYDTSGKAIILPRDDWAGENYMPEQAFKRVINDKDIFYHKVTHSNSSEHITLFGPIVFNDAVKAAYVIHIPASDVFSGRNNIIFVMLSFMLIAIVLVVITGYITSRWVSGRIKDLLRGTVEITKGSLGYQLEDRENDELSELTESFNTMSNSLKDGHEWWKHTFDSMSDAVSIHDLDGRIIKSNSSLSRLVGISDKEMIGKMCSEVIHGLETSCRLCPRKRSLVSFRTEEGEIYEHRLKKWLSISVSPVRNFAGEPENFIHVVRDVTERKETENLIKVQLNRLNVLHSIEKAVSSSLDMHATLDHLVEQVTSRLEIDAATVLMVDFDEGEMDYVVSRGFSSSISKCKALKLAGSTSGKAAMERRIITIQELSENGDGSPTSDILNEEGFVSYFAVPLIAKGEVKGILELYHRSHMMSDSEWLHFLETIADQAAVAIDNAAMFDDLQRSRDNLILAYDSTIIGWSCAMDMRDRETEGHSRRVADLTVRIAEEAGIDKEELVHIRRGALLHDIGKMAIPDSVLLSPGKLEGEELKIMNKHPVYAFKMLNEIEYLKPALDIPYCHHEKWDGSGYPRGLKGSEIPLAARIFAVVDVWDALSSDRPYRKAWEEEKVFNYIRLESGSHFDPEIAEVFIKILSNKKVSQGSG